MDSNHVSPPKAERTLFEDITESGPIHISGRNGNSVKKRLKIEQENMDISNLTHSGQSKKFGYTKKNSNYISPLIPRVLSFYTPQINLMGMPYDIHMEILKFLSPIEILKSVQLVNKYWYRACSDTGLWNSINKTQGLNIDLKYAKRGCVAERRSKGKLFKATSRLSEQEVMIRKINLIVANAGHDDGLPTSILREISYLSSLDHINISNILEVEVKKDTIQICTNYYDYNLKEYMKLHLQNNKEYSLKAYLLQPNSVYKMPLKTIKTLSYQILKGICYLHHQGIIHRNLKCDNILLTKSGQLKITDFALSKLITVPHIPYTPEDPKDRERSGREARRLWYRAPELLLRKNMYSFEVDIWSFGCVLAELAINESLFNGDTEIEQLFQIFRLIGSPNTSSWSTLNDSSDFKAMFPNWESVYFPTACYPQDSDEYKKTYKTMMPNREKAFAKIKNLGSVIGVEGLDLIWNCLSLNPQSRASASTLLNHKFFDEIREEMCVKYIGKSCCPNKTCENTGCYTIPNMLDCHLLSYYNSIRCQEAELRPQSNYLLKQPIINENMRCILVDWLIDVSVHFEVLDETLHLCANYIDRVLSKMKIDKSKLQLVGVTCMKIADVFNERSKEYYKQENSTEYAYITAEEYTPQQLIDMEKVILNFLGFRLNTPNAMQFVKILVHLLSIPDETALVAMFLVDLMLLSYQMLEFDYSLIANSALFIACKSTDHQVDPNLLNGYKTYFEIHSKKDFEKCVNAIKTNWNIMRTTTTYANFEAVYTKYQVRHSFLAKTLNPPDIKSKDLENWFYTKN